MPRPDGRTLVVRGGTVVNAGWTAAADVVIRDGKVTAVVDPGAADMLLSGSQATEVPATGLLILPGGVDPHCHVGFTSGEFTSLDDYRQATTAALLGGTTTIVDFAIPRPGEDFAAVARAQRAKAGQGLCDSALHACVVDWDDHTANNLTALAGEGVTTVKMFTTYRDETMANAETILKVMQHLAPLGGMVYIHCESNPIVEEHQERQAAAGCIGPSHHHHTRPPLAEAASVAEVLSLAETASAPVYFVHQSTPEAVGLVAQARARGVPAFTESVTHHLVLDDGEYSGAHPERFVCCPPLRPRETVDALVGRAAAHEVTTVGSDHCCYDTAQKLAHDDVRHMPNGLPGVETRLPVLYSELVATQRLTLERFVAITAANPARLNGIYPRKGAVMPGSDADLVLWDPTATGPISAVDLHMATDYTPFEGRTATGRPRTVISGGVVVVHDGQLVDDSPRGRHLRAGPVDVTTR